MDNEYMDPAWGNQRREPGKWFDTSDGVGWGDGGSIELMRKDGSVVSGKLHVEEQWTGEDEIPVPDVITLPDGSLVSFFDFEKWRYVDAGNLSYTVWPNMDLGASDGPKCTVCGKHILEHPDGKCP